MLFLPSFRFPSLVTFRFRWRNLRSPHTSFTFIIYHASSLPSLFNSHLFNPPPIFSSPHLSLPSWLSATDFHPLTFLSSSIFLQLDLCFYIWPSVYIPPTFFFWPPHTQPSIRRHVCDIGHVFSLQGKMFITAEVRTMTDVIKIKSQGDQTPPSGSVCVCVSVCVLCCALGKYSF